VARVGERRAAPRVDVDIAAHLVCPGAREPVVVQTRDICCFGLLCRAPRYIAPSTRIGVAMILPVHEAGKMRSELLELSGLVVRTEPDREETGRDAYHVGVYFYDSTPQARALIDQYVRQRREG